ncbi:hypothetical protein BU23DRAFT_2568 [Bimuria novae-zelandiae CBS 107.79]|uniref:Uncharacterized protein n=1 Tax=Bimuria novae-zelandiae CBS 107.79 TaxID=1447943 RepID=A0A6A5VYZ1_9PLEO|nr:hypothetical protein BU23DRAFT_2568 [Bimuria novae-zelandiae CBS 107.79]
MEDIHSSPFFRVPLELREEILSHLSLPQHVHTSSSTPDTNSIHQHIRNTPAYVDTRIYLPSRMPSSLYLVCKQLREECLAYHARRLNSSRHATVLGPNFLQEIKSHTLAERNHASSDDRLERLHDDDSVRVTLEILRQSRGRNVGERREPSPCFMGLTPLLGRLKKLKFIVWAGHDWWSGENTLPVVSVRPPQTARIPRVSSDQDDEVKRAPVWQRDDTSVSLAPRPNPLSVAIDALLQHLPLVDEVKIDLLIHDIDYWNWDLPDTWWEGIRDWLDGPISPIAKGRVKKIDRRLIMVYHGHVRDSGTLLHQRESIQQENTVIHIERGTRKYEDEWEDTQTELSFTEKFERAICLSTT